MIDEALFQEVFDKIQAYLPVGWNKMVFFAGYTDGSYSMKFYSDDIREGFIDCFSLSGIEKVNLIKTFMAIDKILSKNRASLKGEAKWTVFTLIVDSQGNMQAYFDYMDHSEDMVSYEEQWKKQYL